MSTSLQRPEGGSGAPPWRILIVDDEPGVHAVTRLALGRFRYDGRGLEFLSAHSAREARLLLRQHPSIAVMLLDVVMETERAGLELVHFVREEMRDHQMRIVLRTGQPGQAPEHEVIVTYDINDYKAKSELTAQRLTTTLFAALRAYRDISLIDQQKKGLERILLASTHLFSHRQDRSFASALLQQLVGVCGVGEDALCCIVPPGDDSDEAPLLIAAGSGRYARLIDDGSTTLPEDITELLKEARHRGGHVLGDRHCVLHFRDRRNSETLLFVGHGWQLPDTVRRLLEVFCTNITLGFENLHLNRELFDTQVEMICLLAGAAESRSKETANHVKRVGILAEFVAQSCGMEQRTCESLRFAAPLHDIGKIAIPDDILGKPGAHTAEEAAIMRRHAELGHRMLSSSHHPLLQLAADIAVSHHENWDGSGYPRGLAGEAIPIAGRITSLADVFDALGSVRCYKRAWSEDEVRRFIAEQRGRKFDPHLVDVLLSQWERVIQVRRLLPD